MPEVFRTLSKVILPVTCLSFPENRGLLGKTRVHKAVRRLTCMTYLQMLEYSPEKGLISKYPSAAKDDVSTVDL